MNVTEISIINVGLTKEEAEALCFLLGHTTGDEPSIDGYDFYAKLYNALREFVGDGYQKYRMSASDNMIAVTRK